MPKAVHRAEYQGFSAMLKKIISFSIQSVIILAVFMHSCDIDQYSMALFINQIKMFLNVSLKDYIPTV